MKERVEKIKQNERNEHKRMKVYIDSVNANIGLYLYHIYHLPILSI